MSNEEKLNKNELEDVTGGAQVNVRENESLHSHYEKPSVRRKKKSEVYVNSGARKREKLITKGIAKDIF